MVESPRWNQGCELVLIPCIIKGPRPVARQVTRDTASDNRRTGDTAGTERSQDDPRLLDKSPDDPLFGVTPLKL